MKDSVKNFFRAVIYTTGATYTILSFIFLGSVTLITSHVESSNYPNFGYTLGKLFAIFLFSLGLGFTNRIFLLKKSRAVLRLLHFFTTAAWYVITMVFLFLGFFDPEKGITTEGVLLNVILFMVFYPICVGISALFRALTTPKEKKEFKSILD